MDGIVVVQDTKTVQVHPFINSTNNLHIHKPDAGNIKNTRS